MIKYNSSQINIYFVSDTHFGHRNILNFCDRPWNTIEEMNEGLLQNWNSIIKPNDIVFHLGDFAFLSGSEYIKLLSRLNGKIYLILGNHEITRMPKQKILDMFAGVYDKLYIQIDERNIILNHEPLLCWGGIHRNIENAVINLHGHIHSGPNTISKDVNNFNFHPLQYDVGVDNNNYFPISWQQIKEKMNLYVWYARDKNNQLSKHYSEPKFINECWCTNDTKCGEIITEEFEKHKNITFENSPIKI